MSQGGKPIQRLEAGESPAAILAELVRLAEQRDEIAVEVPLPLAWELLKRLGVTLRSSPLE